MSCFELIDRPGFFLIRNALTPESQLAWSRRCLTEFSSGSISRASSLLRHLTFSAVDECIGSHCYTCLNRLLGAMLGSEPSRLAHTCLIRLFQASGSLDPLSSLRWASLGYEYNWTDRQYFVDNPPPPMDLDLARLCRAAAAIFGLSLTVEAAIVNFYQADQVMGGHVDDAELTLEHPIVSLSLGCPGIFLLGGLTRGDAPVPIVLRSGDVAIMSGAARMYVHGVPLILAPLKSPTPDDEEAPTSIVKPPSAEVALVQEYLQTHRLNINTRQMFAANAADKATAVV